MSDAAGERHDLVGRHLDISASLETFRELASARRPAIALADDDGVFAAFELDLGASSNAEGVSELLRDGDLTLLGDSHGRNPTGKTPRGYTSTPTSRRVFAPPNERRVRRAERPHGHGPDHVLEGPFWVASRSLLVGPPIVAGRRLSIAGRGIVDSTRLTATMRWSDVLGYYR
jgi:hypothetical protein